MRMNPPVPPSVTPHRTYFDGRFSNGYIAFEFLWERLSGHRPGSSRGLKPFLESPLLQKTGAINFAFGGTGTPLLDQTPGGFYAPGLKGQIELFRLALRGRQPSPRSLYVVSTGANDYRDDPFNVPMNPVDVVNNIEQAIASLYRIGARHVMVVDLPDLGQVPANGGSRRRDCPQHVSQPAPRWSCGSAYERSIPNLRLTLLELDPLFSRLRTTMEARGSRARRVRAVDAGTVDLPLRQPRIVRRRAADPLQRIVRFCLLGCRASDDRSASLSG